MAPRVKAAAFPRESPLGIATGTPPELAPAYLILQVPLIVIHADSRQPLRELGISRASPSHLPA